MLAFAYLLIISLLYCLLNTFATYINRSRFFRPSANSWLRRVRYQTKVTVCLMSLYGQKNYKVREAGVWLRGHRVGFMDQQENMWVGEVNEQLLPFPRHPWLKCP